MAITGTEKHLSVPIFLSYKEGREAVATSQYIKPYTEYSELSPY